MNHEQKIAEIREALEKIDRGDLFEIAMAHEKSGEWIRFLLDELDRIEREYAEERAAHNAHVTELCEIEKENRKLREEREKWEKEARLQYRLFNEYHDESREKIEQLRAERAKLIEVLRWYADEENQKLDEGTRQWENVYSPYEMDGGQRARNILREIGAPAIER